MLESRHISGESVIELGVLVDLRHARHDILRLKETRNDIFRGHMY